MICNKGSVLYSTLFLTVLSLTPNISQAIELVVQTNVYIAPAPYVIPTESFAACPAVSIWNGHGYVNVYAPDCMTAMIRPEVILDMGLRSQLQFQMNACAMPIPTPAGPMIYYNPACIDRINVGGVAFWERIRPFHYQYFAGHRAAPGPRFGVPESSQDRYRPIDRGRRGGGRIIGMLNQLQELNNPSEDPSSQQTALTAKALVGQDFPNQIQDTGKPAAI
jgi:hypothetical protein